MRYPWLLLALLASGCSWTAEHAYLDAANIHRYRVADSASLSSGPFLLEVRDIYTGAEATNLFVEAVVRNTSDAEATFDSSSLELLDEASGISYYSFARDRTTVGGDTSDYLSTARLGPKRAIEGRLLFITPMKRATSKKYQLRFGRSAMALDHVKRLTSADAPPRQGSSGN